MKSSVSPVDDEFEGRELEDRGLEGRRSSRIRSEVVGLAVDGVEGREDKFGFTAMKQKGINYE